MIIGRKEELHKLEKAFKSKEAQFVTVFGRRRVGKTFLIREFFKKKDCHFLHATGIQNGKQAKQLEKFTEALSKTFYRGSKLASPRNWAEVFKMLDSEIENTHGKVVIFLDELPWMATRRSDIMDELDYYWNNRWAGMSKVILVLCGSASSWIIRKIIKDKGGFHKRTTVKLDIKPFNLSETKEYLRHKGVTLSDKHIVSLYMALGGVPYYLNLAHPKQTAQKNIQRLFFDPHPPLSDEFNVLFDSLLSSPKPYKDILRKLIQRKEGMTRSDINAMVPGVSSGGSLTARLDDLCFSDFIKRYRSWQNPDKVFYKVTDEFCLFYLRWVEPHEGSAFDEDYWLFQSSKPEYHAWAGYAFEAVCRKHIHKILRAIGIRSASPMNPWRYVPSAWNEEGAQVDLVVEQLDNAITLIEMKYTDKPFVIDKRYAANLNRKIAVFKEQTGTKKDVFLAMVAANGVKKTAYAEQLLSAVVTLEDLFNNS